METATDGWILPLRKSNNGFGRNLRCRCLKTNMEFTETGDRSGISYRTCCVVFIPVVMMDMGGYGACISNRNGETEDVSTPISPKLMGM
jgi:hypothetical protein